MAATTTRKKFTARLESIGPGGSWTRMQIPFDAAAAFGSRGRVAVCGTLNGFAFRTSILPNGDGTHHMMLNKALLAGAEASAGERVAVVMERDVASREVATPSAEECTSEAAHISEPVLLLSRGFGLVRVAWLAQAHW